ncbi:MAG: hypothetical protein HC911_15370 [Chloroflexaceae bacterium]|nr:hypothetical protein [Chloroflexaceae bacterium]
MAPNPVPTVTITSDGAAIDNPGPGGWAALLEYGAHERLLVGEYPQRTTNNQMELQAVIASLEALKKPCHIILRADSEYVLNGIRSLLDGKPLPKKNREWWQRLADALARHPHTLDLTWVRGHAGDLRNERVDKEATAAAHRARQAMPAEEPKTRHVDDDLSGGQWVLALCSPAHDRPVQWVLITPTGRITGEVVPEIGPNVALYQAYVAGLKAAVVQVHRVPPHLLICTNLSLLVKQQQGEWKIKDPHIREYHLDAIGLRQSFASVTFEYAETSVVLRYFEVVL